MLGAFERGVCALCVCGLCVCGFVRAVSAVCVECTGVRDAVATACVRVQRGGHGECARRAQVLVSVERAGAAQGECDGAPARVSG